MRVFFYRTTTLDDIYNHYISPKANGSHQENSQRKQDESGVGGGGGGLMGSDEYEEGDVTGYAIQQPAYVSF